MSELFGHDVEKEEIPQEVLAEQVGGTEDEAVDPFSNEYAMGFILVTLMRLYDVQMALLNETDHESATNLSKLHSQGRVLGSFPWINAEA
jgi:hypothetical protein